MYFSSYNNCSSRNVQIPFVRTRTLYGKKSILKILTFILNTFKLNSICEANYWYYWIINHWRIAFGLGWRNPWRFLLTALLIFSSRATFGAIYLQIFIISIGFLVRIEPEFDYLEGSSVAMNYKLIFAWTVNNICMYSCYTMQLTNSDFLIPISLQPYVVDYYFC